jgi:glycosyltransferase involved in cell wall biosynthesis
MTNPVGTPRYSSAGADQCSPRVTIAIPTFNRPNLLIQSIESAVNQNTSESYEIVVSDNFSDQAAVEEVLTYLETYEGPPLRYYLNASNIGMFGNWNICLERARGELVTILSDDDLLLPNFLATMLREIDNKPVGSLICQARTLDQRAVPLPATGGAASLKFWVRGLLRFGLSNRKRVTTKRLFWGNVAGSSLGSVFRRQEALDMGGFDPKDFPSADLGLHLKFARTSGLDQLADTLCVVRIEANESMKPSTLHGFVLVYFKMRQAMLEAGEVPAGWARWARYLLAYEIGVMQKHWGGRVERDEVERDLGVKVPVGLPAGLMWGLRALHGGV